VLAVTELGEQEFSLKNCILKQCFKYCCCLLDFFKFPVINVINSYQKFKTLAPPPNLVLAVTEPKEQEFFFGKLGGKIKVQEQKLGNKLKNLPKKNLMR
jgi:hypothetical protein